MTWAFWGQVTTRKMNFLQRLLCELNKSFLGRFKPDIAHSTLNMTGCSVKLLISEKEVRFTDMVILIIYHNES